MSAFLERLRGYISPGRSFACWVVVFCPVAITLIGLVALSSASLSFYRNESLLHRQLTWFLISIIFFLVGLLLDLDFVRRCAGKILFALLVLLVLVLIPGIGHSVNGSRRWISAMGVSLQISEFTKVALIIWLADYIDSIGDKVESFSEGFFRPFAVAACASGLILLEPDYGTAILLGGVSLSLLFLYGSRVSYVAGAVAIATALMSLLTFFNPVRMRRILAFIDIDANKLGGAYQLWQGILGFASGGLWGNGIGNGKQQLVYLPEAHTDFILPILGEEFGSIAVILVMALYLAFAVTCITRAMKIKCTYRSAVSCGIALLVAYQVIINIGVVSGLLPTKGMALPFVSYGGSNLLAMYFLLGILLNCFFFDQKLSE
ncbi:MAG: putative lipid II flippase FtsW [Puniceicoccales bacterium]|jgi:cell division protein FtsW|nr:putative lipid II flippase FtsW [Puniceicoccales bacterium]